MAHRAQSASSFKVKKIQPGFYPDFGKWASWQHCTITKFFKRLHVGPFSMNFFTTWVHLNTLLAIHSLVSLKLIIIKQSSPPILQFSATNFSETYWKPCDSPWYKQQYIVGSNSDKYNNRGRSTYLYHTLTRLHKFYNTQQNRWRKYGTLISPLSHRGTCIINQYHNILKN